MNQDSASFATPPENPEDKKSREYFKLLAMLGAAVYLGYWLGTTVQVFMCGRFS